MNQTHPVQSVEIRYWSLRVFTYAPTLVFTVYPDMYQQSSRLIHRFPRYARTLKEKGEIKNNLAKGGDMAPIPAAVSRQDGGTRESICS